MARPGGFTLASFNVHYGLDRHGRPFDVIAACRRLDTDVIALQETWRERGQRGVAGRVADALGYELLEAPMGAGAPHAGKGLDLVADAARATGTWGIAVLSRLPLRPLAPIELGVVKLDLGDRRALVVEVDAPGGAVRVVCAHLSHRPWGALAQLRRLRRGLGATSGPTVVAGDMNMWGPVVTGMLPGLRRAVTGRTWPAHRPHSHIDHILVSAGVEVEEAVVLPALGSDHRPVRARLLVHGGTTS